MESQTTAHSVHLPYILDPVRRHEHAYRIAAVIDLARPALEGIARPRVLEVGCGRGEILKALRDAFNAETVGMDIDPVCVEFAKEVGEGWLADAIQMVEDDPEGTRDIFDLVVSSHSLEHMPRPADAMNAMAHMSKRPLVIMIPNAHFLISFVKTQLFRRIDAVNMGHYYAWDAMHFHRFIVTQMGLEIEEWACDWVPVVPGRRLRKLVLRAGLGGVLRMLETRAVPKLFPYLGESLAVRCVKATPDVRAAQSAR